MIRVDLETVEAWDLARRKFNRLDLMEIDFYRDGKKIEIPTEVKDRFQYTGLLNIDFVTSDFFDWNDTDD